MKTNLDKWNYYLSIVNEKTDQFINAQKEGKVIPNVYYIVYPAGKIAERTIIGVEYAHYKHNGKTYLGSKKPTKKEVAELAEYSAKEIPFSVDYIWFTYSEVYNKETGAASQSSVNFMDVINQKGLFHSISDAEEHSRKVIEEKRIDTEFRETHKKDASYKYDENGYKFLGWQNGWKHVYYDEDGNLCSESGKPHRSGGYTKDDYPEYGNCMELKHKRIEVQHNQRGSENTVSCPLCKIYWKYDCSD